MKTVLVLSGMVFNLQDNWRVIARKAGATVKGLHAHIQGRE